MTTELQRARAEATLRRAQFLSTARAVQQRLSPATIAENAVESAKRKGEEIAEDAVDAVRRRPVAASAAVAGVTALLGFGLFNKFRKTSEGDDE